MSKWRFEQGKYVLDEPVPDSLVSGEGSGVVATMYRQGRRDAFKYLMSTAAELKISDPGKVLYYSVPLGGGCDYSIVAGTVLGSINEDVLQVFININEPHDVAEYPDARRLRMTAYAASRIGKRFETYTSSAVLLVPGGDWKTDDKYVGPQIVPFVEAGAVALRGHKITIEPELPELKEKSSEQHTQDREAGARALADILSLMSPIHIQQGFSIFPVLLPQFDNAE